MNQKQINKYTMLDTLNDFLKLNENTFFQLPMFGTFYDQLLTITEELGVYHAMHMVDITWITNNKNNLRTELDEIVFDNMQRLNIYAKLNNIPELLNETSYNESNISKLPDSKISLIGSMVHKNILKYLNNLEQYDIKKADADLLLKKLQEFNETTTSTRLSVSERKSVTDIIERKLKESDDVLDKLDSIVELLRKKNTLIYDQYFNNRKIVDKGAGYLALSAYITDVLTNQGIGDVQVVFTRQKTDGAKNTNGSDSITKYTSAKGLFRIKNMETGTYSVTITKEGYKTVNTTIVVTNTEMVFLNKALEKMLII